MTDAAIISGSLVDVRNVGTHKSVKLTIHVPEELAMKVVAAFGWPTGVNPVSVAIARLDERKVVETATIRITGPTTETPPRQSLPRSAGADKIKRAFHELPYAQQAALRCNEPVYWAFLREMCAADSGDVRNSQDAAEAVRKICEVASRADIRPGSEAEKRWLQLERWHDAWRTEERALA